jgi:hypothetical protein
VWYEIVSARPWNWFAPEQFPTLADYCRVVVEGDWYARALTAIGDPTKLTAEEDVDRYKWYSREDRTLTALKASLANKLRLTIRSQRATSVPVEQSFSVPVSAPRPPDADAPPRRPIPVGPIPPWHPFNWESSDQEWAEYERNLAAAGVPSGPMGMPTNEDEEAAPQKPPREEDGDR